MNKAKNLNLKVENVKNNCNLRICSLNVGTMCGRANEVVETLERRHVDICCVQETRWRGGSARMISGKSCRYKFFWIGDDSGTGGVGILLAEKWIEKVISVDRVDNRQMCMRILVGKITVNIQCVYAPQSGRSNAEKDEFFSKLLSNIVKVPEDEILMVCGDLNGHVGKTSAGFEGHHGGKGFGDCNPEGVRILDMCTAADLAVTNTFFNKRDSQLISYRSGSALTQVDYILVRRCDLRLVRDTKIIGSEECTSQHKLLVCDISLRTITAKPRNIPPKRKIWKLKDPETCAEFEEIVNNSAIGDINDNIDINTYWNEIKACLFSACDKVCGWTRGGKQKQRETWWWDNSVNKIIKQKRKLWKEWQKGGDKEKYLEAKRKAKSAVYAAKKKAQEENLSNLKSRDGKNYIFKLAKRMKYENKDIIGVNCVKNDDGNLAHTDKEKLDAWKCHYNRLLNVEFPWDRNSLSEEQPVEGPAIWITEDMVSKSINIMKKGKAAGPSGVVIELIRAGGKEMIRCITILANHIVCVGAIPADWNLSFIINCYKGKGDALERGNYRGLKLLEQVLKVIERVLEGVIREQVSIDNMQFGFCPGRGTNDAIFILRQMHEKHIARKRNLFFAFVDLEKAFDRVPRDVLWWAMRKLGVEEWVVRIVKAMYVKAKSKVRLNGLLSDEFDVKVGVHQGSVLSPLLFIIVMEALSREFRVGCPWELLYADDLVIMAETIEELEQRLGLWKQRLEAKGLRVNMGKTKILCSRHDVKPKVDKSKWPCAVCRKGVGSNSILCRTCNHWVHKRCSGVRGRLVDDPTFKCKVCTGVITPPVQGLAEISIGDEKLEVVDAFCYLGDVTDQTGGCFDATTARVRSAWKNFRELLPVLTNKGISLRARGHAYNACIRSILLYASETWPVKSEDINRLIRSDNAMVRWICSVKLSDRKSMKELRNMVGISEVEDVVRYNRLRWFGHTQRMEEENWPRKIIEFDIGGKLQQGGQRKRWIHNINRDMDHLHINKHLTQDRVEWRKAIQPRRHDRVVQPPKLGKQGR